MLAFVALAFGSLPTSWAIGFGPDFEQQPGATRLLGSSYANAGVDATYDYIVVGGGNSGLTIAKRLAEVPGLSVAIVEAGGYYETDSNNQTQIPAYNVLYESSPPTIDWGDYSTPQPQLNGRSPHYAQGKTLGGGTARNAMAYQRGTTGSYAAWANMSGDQSWTLPNIMPYFQKSCNFTPPNVAQRGGPPPKYDSSAFSSSGGPLKVSFWNYYIPASDFVRQALIKLGLQEIDSIQSGNLLGFAQYPGTVNPDVAVRDSSETSFGREALETTSLQFYIRTLAKKITFSGRRATGVVVNTAGSTYTLTARREVILAAGPFRSPQLLLVSGVGPKADLATLDIPLVANLPGVGKNMLDQPGFGIVFPVNVSTQHELFSNASFAEEARITYLQHATGPMSIYASNYLAWEHLSAASRANLTKSQLAQLDAFPADWPDVQYIFNMAGIANNDTRQQMSIVITLQKASSLGSVTINSTDTADPPLIDVAWLRTRLDQRVAIQTVRRAREMAAATGIAAGDEIFPGPSVQSDADILAFLKKTLGTSHHAVTTCRMGKKGDATAVVDSNGLVMGGVTGLRIVDTSAWALLPPGQPMAGAYMMAEKLADVIKKGL